MRFPAYARKKICLAVKLSYRLMIAWDFPSVKWKFYLYRESFVSRSRSRRKQVSDAASTSESGKENHRPVEPKREEKMNCRGRSRRNCLLVHLLRFRMEES
jgi:hypothetical protein